MKCVAVAFCSILLGGAAMADPAEGVWKTEPDKKDQVAHVQVYDCARILCGKIIKTFDSTGQSIEHKNIGKLVFWDMTAQGDGTYEGRAFVPAHNREYPGKLVLKGDRLDVGGCLGPICMSQKWTRVK